MDEDGVVLAGWLEKSPPLNKVTSGMKGWKKRWFVLRRDSNLLNYYTSSTAKPASMKGGIDMELAAQIEGNQVWPGPQKDRHPWCLTIALTSGRIFYLSAPTEETMQDWVKKLISTFKFYLAQNNKSEDDDEYDENLANGIVPVDVSLVSTTSTVASMQIQETTTTAEVIAKVLKKTGATEDTKGLYVICAVDIPTDTANVLNPSECPLPVLRVDHRLKLYLVHTDEAHYIIKLIKLEQAKSRLERGQFDESYNVQYLGSLPVQGPSGTRKPPSYDTIREAYESLKKNPRGYDTKLEMIVNLDGIKVVTPTGNPRKPFTVVMEQSLHGVANCIDIDKAFIYVSAPPPDAPPDNRDFKVYSFKCENKATAQKIKEQLTISCNQVFAQLHEAAKKSGMSVQAVLQSAATGAPVAKPVPEVKADTTKEAEATQGVEAEHLAFEDLDEEELAALLQAAEIPQGVSSLADIEKFLDDEASEDDDEEAED